MANVLVTGGFGFLGEHVCRALNPEHGVFRFRSSECDLLDIDKFETLVGKVQPDIIIHLAATCGGIGANKVEPARFFYENMQMGMNVLEVASWNQVNKVVMIGTTCSYPWTPPRIPFVEDDLWKGYPEKTNAPYGVAKRALLTMGQAYREQHGLNVIHLIPANLYGPGDNFDLRTSHVIPAIIRKMVEARDRAEDEVVLWGDGSPTREFLHARDAARGIVSAMESYDGYEPVNLGTGQEVSIADLAGYIKHLTKFEGKIVWDTKKPNGQPRRVLDTSRARMMFGWEAEISLCNGLKETIAWHEGP